MPKKLIVPGLVFVVVLLGGLSFTHVFDDFAGRIFEYENEKSSTYGRYVYPILLIGEQFSSDPLVFIGHGPGTGDAVGAGFSLGKLLYEYGVVGLIFYYFAFLRMLLKNGHSFLINWALFLYFSFLGGGLGVPLYPLTCVVLGGLLRSKVVKQ